MTNFRSARRGTAGFNTEAARPQNMENPFDVGVRILDTGLDAARRYNEWGARNRQRINEGAEAEWNQFFPGIPNPIAARNRFDRSIGDATGRISNEYQRISREAQQHWAREYVRNESAGVPWYDPGQIGRFAGGLASSLGGCNTERTAAILGLGAGVSNLPGNHFTRINPSIPAFRQPSHIQTWDNPLSEIQLRDIDFANDYGRQIERFTPRIREGLSRQGVDRNGNPTVFPSDDIFETNFPTLFGPKETPANQYGRHRVVHGPNGSVRVDLYGRDAVSDYGAGVEIRGIGSNHRARSAAEQMLIDSEGASMISDLIQGVRASSPNTIFTYGGNHPAITSQLPGLGFEQFPGSDLWVNY